MLKYNKDLPCKSKRKGGVSNLNNPKLSIIIPCYNAQKFLPSCFNCLDNQTYSNLQIIFIDDGSTDNTLDLIKEYCQKKANALFVTGENQGVGASRNKGLELIDGEYFTFYDADDIIFPTHFENLINIIVRENADISACGIKRAKEERAKKLAYNDKGLNKLEIFEGKDCFTQYLSQEKLDFVLWNKVFSTKILKESGAEFLNTRYGEEAYFLYNYFKCVKKVVFCPCKTYVYLQHKKSLMHLGFNESRLDIITNLDEIKKDAENFDKEISSYVSSMRAGYLVGLLYFIKKSDYKNSQVISQMIKTLTKDVKQLKGCKKTALYKRVFIPLIPTFAKLALKKKLKNASK